jgi:DNA-binding MarR family transcriptional regulator
MDEAEEPDRSVAALLETTKLLTAVAAHSLASLHSTMSVPQLRVLVMIDAQGPMNLTTVAEGLGVNASNASRTCDRLVSSGLLARRTDERDRRSIVLSLTQKGQRLVDTVMRQRRSMLEQIVHKMDVEQQGELASGLAAFVEAALTVSGDGGLSDGEGHLLRGLV